MSRQKSGTIDRVGKRFRVRVTGTSGRATVGIFDTLEEAEIARESTMRILTAETEPGNGETVGSWLEKHLAKREKDGVIRDHERDRGRFNVHVASHPIARITLKSVRPHHIDAHIDLLRDKGLAPQSIINVIHLLSGAFSKAFRRGLMRSNPAWRATVDRSGVTHEPWTYATPKEQERLIKAAGRMGEMVEFSIGSGLRAGEMVTLRLNDVHYAAVEPYVTVRYGAVPDLPTKGKRIRDVPLFGHGLAAVKRQLAKMKGAPNKHGLLFPAPRGGFRRANCVMLWDEWVEIRERAALGRPFRWHDLRHTCASSLVSGWWGRSWTLVEVKGMLGHKSITTTERYAHLADSALKAAARSTAKNWPAPNAAGKTGSIDDTEIESSVLSASPSDGPSKRNDSNAFGVIAGASHGQLLASARAFLQAVHEDSDADLAAVGRAFAEAVLASPTVALALRVRAGGPLALTRAIDLATKVLEGETASAPSRVGGDS